MFCFSRITTARYVLTLIVWSGLVLTPTIGWSEDAVSLPEARVIVQCGTIEAGAMRAICKGLPWCLEIRRIGVPSISCRGLEPLSQINWAAAT
jgi:hypothetical protein